MTTQEQSIQASKNTILVFEDADGTVRHVFCTQAEATERLKSALDAGSGGSMLFNSDEMDAKMLYDVSPDLRARVETAKCKLRGDLIVRDALNRHGIPNDRELRANINKVIADLRKTVLQPVF